MLPYVYSRTLSKECKVHYCLLHVSYIGASEIYISFCFIKDANQYSGWPDLVIYCYI